MTDQERRAGEGSHEAPDRHDDASPFDPPRLVVMGSMEELTRGNTTAGTEGSFSEGV
jgi:hypothetical protein